MKNERRNMCGGVIFLLGFVLWTIMINVASIRLVEKFHFEKGGCEEITTESGKMLTLQTYHVFN